MLLSNSRSAQLPLCSLLLSTTIIVSAPVFAQEAPTEAEAAVSLDTIIVTGTKREMTLQDADVAATVLTETALKNARVTDIRRIDDLAPNVQFNELGAIGGVFVTIRGVESNPFIVNRAAVYIDGIPFRELSNSVLTQLESVEVLRGPQSTLYGANTETGLILIRTRAPSDSFEANAIVTGSTFETGDAYQVEGYIGGPLVRDQLASSLSLRYSNRDNFMENIGSTPQGPGEIKELFLQARTRWTPNDAFTLNATAYVIDTDAPGVYTADNFPIDIERYNQVYSDGILFDPSNPVAIPPANGDIRIGEFQYVSDAPKSAQLEDIVAGLSAEYDTGVGSIEVSLSYRSEESDDRGFDIDKTNGAFLAGAVLNDLDVWNAEVRWQSPEGDPLVYTIGASYYTDEETEEIGSLIGLGGLSDYNFSPEQARSSKDFGIFGSASFTPPFAPKLTLTAGLRYDNATRESSQQEGVLDLGFAQFVFDELDLEETFEAWLPRFAARYEFTDNFTMYTNIARGYLPGGFNLAAAQAELRDQLVRFDSETLWSYEIGARWQSPDRSAYLSGAVFFIETENFQEINDLVDENGNVASTSFIGSTAATESYGFEIEGQWTPSDELTITGNLGIIEAEYTDYAEATAADVIGNPVKLVPEYDANIAGLYEHPSGFFIRGEVDFVGETALNEGAQRFVVNVEDNTQDAVVRIGAQLGYEADNWSVRLFGENLTDERRVSSIGNPGGFFTTDGILYGVFEAPRVVGVELGVNY